ncbi:exodeoxyribonuclease VII large subunit [Neomicrococcus aestuarii]|uniref:Exodeoxyribonuclease 7 large subunit n=1 Tax=Neomicrococcus aestuarii TaxID=556325 RepID=A0A7W8TVF8_9MICC|nr:exodeoxyribonuclease VII large subunit [Neomicrococcus aestuarii]MBB5513624.1 exodeoxyribonuclease VII large subunit [Neomicrococcus aestuarii]
MTEFPTEPPSASIPERAGDTTPESPWPLRVLSENLKRYFERAPEAWIEGQLIEANIRGGHAYLTMRDLDVEYSLSLTVWSSVLRGLDAKPEVGSRVVARVKPSFWLKNGRLSMNALDLKPVGIGDLMVRLEKLRQALFDEGLFAPERKKKLPFLPQRIGLITGRDSDAEKDVLRNAALRWPGVTFEVRHTAVQGVNAVSQVIAALKELDAHPDVDVIVIARGGGSFEDLFPFSDEQLVRAVSAANTPVVSAIGHEADRPILDDVADLRASTPTDAAKRIVPDFLEETSRINHARDRMELALTRFLEREARSLESLRTRPVMAAPEGMVNVRREDLERLTARSYSAVTHRLRRDTDAITHLRTQVRALSPQKTLDRGYSVVQRAEDLSIVRHPEDAPSGASLLIRLAGGKITAVSEGEPPHGN